MIVGRATDAASACAFPVALCLRSTEVERAIWQLTRPNAGDTKPAMVTLLAQIGSVRELLLGGTRASRFWTDKAPHRTAPYCSACSHDMTLEGRNTASIAFFKVI